MLSLIVGLTFAVVALEIQAWILRDQRTGLKFREQSYHFHALRDRLQLLTLEGKIRQESAAYQFLIQVLNLCIKNAGVMKLRQVMAVAKLVDRRISQARSEALMADIRRHGDEVKTLSGETFMALSLMLISNDSVTYVASFLLGVAAEHYAHPHPPTFRGIAKKLLGKPRTEVLREARKYRELGSQLCPTC